MKKQHPQLGFTFITSLNVLLPMVEFRQKVKKYVTCVNKNLHQINLKIYTPEVYSGDEDNHFGFSYQILHSSHTKVGFSSTTCVHTWYKSQW